MAAGEPLTRLATCHRYAAERTRTSTGVSPQTPEACVYTNFTTAAWSRKLSVPRARSALDADVLAHERDAFAAVDADTIPGRPTGEAQPRARIDEETWNVL